MNEIVNAQEQIALVQLILKNTLTALGTQPQPQQQAPVSRTIPKPQTMAPNKPTAKPAAKTTKAKTPKKAPYVAAPKPLPQAKAPVQTSKQLQDQRIRYQQGFAKQIAKELSPKPNTPIPNSLKPLPTSILSPVKSIDPEQQEKFNQASDDAKRKGIAPVNPNRETESKARLFR